MRAITHGLLGALFILVLGPRLYAAEILWKAGVAKADITPAEPVWLAGYGGAARPAHGKVMELWVKALALEDAHGHRAVILTSDTLGISQPIYRAVCAALKQKPGLEPAQVILSASHTHCGPILRNALYDMYPIDEDQRSLIEKYSAELETKIVETFRKALDDLAPARLAAGQGTAAFAVNRRNNPEAKVPQAIADGALKGPI